MKTTIAILLLLIFGGGLLFLFLDIQGTKESPDKSDLIRVESPKSGQSITSPVSIRGVARGPWFFEANFSIALVDSERAMIGETIATAEGEWMTEDFVPFEAELYFETAPNIKSNKGTLIFRKQNESGLPEHEDSFELDVQINGNGMFRPNPTIAQEISFPYEDGKTGIRFEYKVSPNGYILEELPKGSNEDPDLLNAIILTRIADSEALKKDEGGREGPPTINVYAFKSDGLKLSSWLESKSQFTNFNNDSWESFVMGGVEGIYYTWDGLYQGETVAILRDDKVYMVVGTYLSGINDGRRMDFRNITNSFGLIQ